MASSAGGRHSASTVGLLPGQPASRCCVEGWVLGLSSVPPTGKGVGVLEGAL